MKTTDDKQRLVRTSFFPRYSDVRKLLPILNDQVAKAELTGLERALCDQGGTPQNPLDWSNPDTWIEGRLTGKDRDLARRIWQESGKTVNPRYLYGPYLLIGNHALMDMKSSGPLQLTDTGQHFVDGDPATLRAMDKFEGVPQLLAILAAHSPARRADIFEEWQEFVLAHSNFTSKISIEGTLRERLINLIERGYVTREGNTYTITNPGIDYATLEPDVTQPNPRNDVLRTIKQYNDSQTQRLRECIAHMPPYRFEMLVRDLLEAMEYEDVEVTKQAGDKGIDVVAHFQFGITRIREVVQVKRWQDSVTRPTIDQLRGALPYYQALRGTIITLGKFSKGCEEYALFPGAAPITLIDGDMLIDLLLKHEVGISKQSQALLTVDDEYFADPEAEPVAE